VELLFVIAVAAALAAMAIPAGVRMTDDYRAANAARYLAQKCGYARIDAVRRSIFVGIRFGLPTEDYLLTAVADGNGNGLRTAEIASGIDRRVGSPERLDWNFPGVAFGILPGVPDADGNPPASSDGVRLGASRILSMNPDGSSSSGTLYVHTRRGAQYAVRVLGATGRVRMLKYLETSRAWVER
jgi:hypothetical protein